MTLLVTLSSGALAGRLLRMRRSWPSWLRPQTLGRVQVPVPPSRRIHWLTSRMVSHCAAPQLWPVLTDGAMETQDLCLLQEPQISRAEKREWGRGCTGVQTRVPLEALLPRLSRRYTEAARTHANVLTPP